MSVKPEHLAEREKALAHIQWIVELNRNREPCRLTVLGYSDAILEDTLLLAEIKEYLTEEEWKEFISTLLKGE